MSFPNAFYRWRPHPWHGLEVGLEPPLRLQAYIEMTPFDRVKYEIDKQTGYLRVDRPQATSAMPPTLYGFVPRTFCGERVSKLSPNSHQGDGDPVDICVLSERPIDKAEILLNTRVVGGLQMVDGGEADDKIIAVFERDDVWNNITDITDIPTAMINRLTHYFSTYKMIYGEPTDVSIETVYGVDYAKKVIEASIADYRDEFGD